MRQYKITFYYKRITHETAIYYREFETVAELKDWCKSVVNECSLYSHFKHKKISKHEFLRHI